MKLIDVSVLLDGSLPAYPGNVRFSVEPTKRIANGDDSSTVPTLHLSALPLRMVGDGGAPACGVRRQS